MPGSTFRSSRIATLSILSFLASLPSAFAKDAEILGSGWGDAPSDSRIVGGKKVPSCDFPTTFFIKASSGKGASVCTASLVHPQIIMTAAHCLKKTVEVASGDGYHGEDKKTLKWRAVEKCVGHPDWKGNNASGRGKDFAYCKLKEPVKDIKPVPILMGCEVKYLEKGTPITLVGFGNTEIGESNAGTKHEIDSKVVGFSSFNEVEVGGVGAGSLRGDSGGPAYVKLPEKTFKKDAGWRVFGVTSVSAGADGPDGRAFYGQLHRFVAFVEKDSGIDVTPCTDADGTWNPSEACKEAPLDPRAPTGDWIKGCKPQPYGGYIASCGEPFGKGKEEEKDEEAPEVEIMSPEDDKEFEFGAKKVEIKVNAKDNVGVTSVKLSVNGDEEKEDKEAPYEWTLKKLEPGEYELEAVAVDEAGNEGKSKTVNFTILEEEKPKTKDDPSGKSPKKTPGESKKTGDPSKKETPSPEESSESDEDSAGSDSSGEESSNNDSKGALDTQVPGRCSVSASEGGWTAALLALPLLAGIRRRRRS